jgi:hypothetical protein
MRPPQPLAYLVVPWDHQVYPQASIGLNYLGKVRLGMVSVLYSMQHLQLAYFARMPTVHTTEDGDNTGYS